MADSGSTRKITRRVEDLLEAFQWEENQSTKKLTSEFEKITREENLAHMPLSESLLLTIRRLCISAPLARKSELFPLLFDLHELDPENRELSALMVNVLSDLSPEEKSLILQDVFQKLHLRNLNEEDLQTLDELAIHSGISLALASAYAKLGVFRTELLEEILGQVESEDLPRELFTLYTRSGHTAGTMRFLQLLEKHGFDRAWVREEILRLLKNDDKDAIKKELDGFPYSSLKNSDEYILLTDKLTAIGDLQRSLDLLNHALSSHNSDVSLLTQKVNILLLQGENMEAYEIIKQVLGKQPTDLELAGKAVSIAYSQKLLDEFLELLNSYPDLLQRRDFLAMRIDVELQKSLFSEALKDISTALSIWPSDLEFGKLKFRTLVKLNNSIEAYNIARELIESDPEFADAVHYVMNSLFQRGEYQQIMALYDEHPNMRLLEKHILAASLFYLDRKDEALNEINATVSLAEDPLVLDSIFFTVRSESILKPLENFEAENHDLSVALRIILGRLRGIPVDYSIVDEKFIDRFPSTAIAYIAASSYVSRRKTLPPAIANIISRPSFNGVKTTLELVASAMSGRISEDVTDSPRYLYPVSTAFIQDGKLDRAERELLRSSSDTNEPFYLYLISRIDYMRGDLSSSRKNLEDAIGSMANADFIVQGILLAMVNDDRKRIRDYSEKLVALGSLNSIDLSPIEALVSRNNLWNVAGEFVEEIEQQAIRNPWIYRLKRGIFAAASEFTKAIDQSSMLFKTRQFNREDIEKHISILQRMGMASEILQFLMDLEIENKTVDIELMVADRLHDQGKHKKALEFYGNALQMGVEPAGLPNYIDSLIEIGETGKAEEIISKAGNDLLQLKLYHKGSRIPESLALLRKLTFKSPEDERTMRYAVSNLWYNRDVRDLIFRIFESGGFVWLGKLICRKAFEEGDRKLAIEIGKNMNKNDPSDLEVVKMLTDLLAKSGERTEAVELILNSLKYCGDFSLCQDLVNVLLRLYYEDRDYDGIVKFYETNPKYVDEDSLQYVIRSYIENEDFDTAERMLSRYEGTLLNKELHQELQEGLKVKREFMETILYVTRLLKLEYKAHKKFDKKEAFYKADIPIEKIEDVFAFLDSREFYFDINEEKYETLSRDVIQKAAKAYPMDNISDLTIAVIFNALERKDPIIARNLYIYVHDQMDVARRPQTKNNALLKLVKIAIKEDIRQEPLNIAFYLQIGIAEALEVMTLMDYISKMNEESRL